MSLPAVPRSLQLPPGQRARPAFREQRRHNLKELLLERKARFVYKEDYRTLSSICGILLQSIPSSRVLNRFSLLETIVVTEFPIIADVQTHAW
ncbi:cytoskeleton-associated protein 2-like isoform X2 [Tamandua tetradactyla]|uniref:cytoskeleton-associated protein 2-like isoform X2 n=1 Tax=Tamandua tetradactyla TaxID=48850 RepID=UPI004053B9A4